MTLTPTTIDTAELLELFKALKGVEAETRLNANRRLRAAAGECAAGLVVALRVAGAGAATPQARLVAASVKIKSDRVPAVSIGGSRKVGSRRTPAGVLLWGSERGGRTFAAAPGGAYWIRPTVETYNRGPAIAAYQRAVVGILSDAGVL